MASLTVVFFPAIVHTLWCWQIQLTNLLQNVLIVFFSVRKVLCELPKVLKRELTRMKSVSQALRELPTTLKRELSQMMIHC